MNKNYYIALFIGGGSMAEFAGSIKLYGPMDKTSAKSLSHSLYNELSLKDSFFADESMVLAVESEGPQALSKEICELVDVPQGSIGFDVKAIAKKVCEEYGIS